MKLDKNTSFSKMFFVIIIIIIINILVIDVKANIICNDGTISSGCADCHQGCCSRHGGCTPGYTGSSNNSNNYNNSSSSSAISSYTAPVIRQKSSNNKIKSITIDNKKIVVKDEMSYTTTKNTVSVNVILESSLATADYSRTVYLDHGDNNETIVVTAENGNKKTYYLNIKHANNSTIIKEIKINGSSISLNDMTYDSVSDSIDLEVIPEDEYAKVEYEKKVTLKDGDNEIPITVIAENGNKKQYKLIVKYDEVTNAIATVLTVGGLGAAATLGIKKVVKKKK